VNGPDTQPDATTEEHTPSRTFRILFTAALIVIALGYGWLWREKTERLVIQPPPPLAASYITGESNLRAQELELAVEQRLRELRHLTVIKPAEWRSAATDTAVLFAAARRDSAGYALVGTLTRTATGALRAELQRYDLDETGARFAFYVEGADVDELARRAAIQLAMRFGVPIPDYSPSQ
jgi:hypothetical protein